MEDCGYQQEVGDGPISDTIVSHTVPCLTYHQDRQGRRSGHAGIAQEVHAVAHGRCGGRYGP